MRQLEYDLYVWEQNHAPAIRDVGLRTENRGVATSPRQNESGVKRMPTGQRRSADRDVVLSHHSVWLPDILGECHRTH